MRKRRNRPGRLWTCVASCLLAASALPVGGTAQAASPAPTTQPSATTQPAGKGPGDPAARPAEHELPDVTITGRKPPVEQGERSAFTALRYGPKTQPGRAGLG